MFNKLKEVFSNPYWAPVTQPLKNIASFAYTPVKGFAEAVMDGVAQTREYGGNIVSNVLGNTIDVDAGFPSFIATLFGGAIGAIGAGLVGGAAAYSLMAGGGAAAQIATTVVAAIGAAGIGAVTAPFVVMGALALAGAVVGVTLATIPGIVSGSIKALNHHRDVKNGRAVAAKLSPQQAADTALVDRLNKALKGFRELPKEDRPAFVKMLAEDFAQSVKGSGDSLLQTIDALPAAERESLVRGLRVRLAESFDAVADKDVANATVLDDKLVVDKPLKIVPRQQRKA